MSDEGEKTCPLCAEEMDLTDQQLKPCKCGYEICVWCWHHIMDMAEKDETEGRCPACRAPYNKEKIVGMTANCERLVAELNMERKKSHKTKSKTSEGRKQLSTVRVIQRNLVYIVGLPLHLADEDLLQRKEYFGQYGKVLKVSMSRTAAGVIQQFPNNTCSVYITYSKDEEAVRCIQTVHGFILEGRPLRACFGTTKYCHAWLRNVACSNPDCLYLHEIGSQEDSFTKDEIISAFTRSRVQQITGAANNQQRRSGNVLPPPLDDYNSSGSTGKPITKTACGNVTNYNRGSPPNGRAIGLPPAASWAARASNPQPPAATLACTNGPLKQKPDTVGGTMAFSSAVSTTAQASNMHSDTVEKPTLNGENHSVQSKGKMEVLKSSKQYISMDTRSTLPEKPAVLDGTHGVAGPNGRLLPSASRRIDQSTSSASNSSHSLELIGKSTLPEKEVSVSIDGNIPNLCSELSSISINKNIRTEQCDMSRPGSSLSEHGLSNVSEHQESSEEKCREHPTLQAVGKASPPTELSSLTDQCDWRSDPRNQGFNRCPEVEEEIPSFDNQRLKDPEHVSHSSYASNSVDSLGVLNHSKSHSLQQSESCAEVSTNRDPLFLGSKISDGSSSHGLSGLVLSGGLSEKLVQRSSGLDGNTDHSLLFQSDWKDNYMGNQGDSVDRSSDVPLDNGESRIISRILSWDVDTLHESLTSPQNLAKLLGKTDERPASLSGISGSWKVNNNNQSRFSFARQEDSKNQLSDVEQPFSLFGQFSGNRLSSVNSSEIRDQVMEKPGAVNCFPSHSFKELDNCGSSSHFAILSNKLSVKAPPGFSVPSRAPPPGFTSHERAEQAYGITSGNHLLDGSSLLRSSYQTPSSGSISSSGDVELIDPAILAVGKGRLQSGPDSLGLDMRSNYPPQLGARENDARLQLLMQRSLSQRQNLRYSGIGDNYSRVNDSYGIPSRLIDQSQLNNMSPFAQLSLQQSRNSLVPNGHWDGWNEVQGGSDLGMAELVRNERLGFNKFYSNYDDSKFCMSSTGDLYNRTYGM